MLILIFRFFVLYAIAVIGFRLMGKRQIGEMQPYELVITFILAEFTTIPLSDVNVPLLNGLVPLVALLALHSLISFCTRKSIKFRKIVDGTPVIVMTPNGIDYDALKSLNMNINDLDSALRLNNVFNLDNVLYAIIETNGKLSVLQKKKDNASIENDLAITLICDGEIMVSNLELLDLEENTILALLKKHNIKNEKNILLFTMTRNGKCYLQEKSKKFLSFSFSKKGDSEI